MLSDMAKGKEKVFEVACPDCGAMLRIDAATGLVVSHTPHRANGCLRIWRPQPRRCARKKSARSPSSASRSTRKRTKADLLEKKFAEALRKAKDAPDVKPLREFDLD